jgi:hypothetical protein
VMAVEVQGSIDRGLRIDWFDSEEVRSLTLIFTSTGQFALHTDFEILQEA